MRSKIENRRAQFLLMAQIRICLAMGRMSRAVYLGHAIQLLCPCCHNDKRGRGNNHKRRIVWTIALPSPTHDRNHAPVRDMESASTFEQKLPNIAENLTSGGNFANQGSIRAPAATQWLLLNVVIDSRPSCAPNLHRNWRREVKLWRYPQIGANATQLISEISSALPKNSRKEI